MAKRRRKTRLIEQVKEKYLLSLLAAVFGALVFSLYWYALPSQADGIFGNIAAELIAACLILIGINVLFVIPGILPRHMNPNEPIGALVGFYDRHEDVDWDAVIDAATTLDIFVCYYGSWVRDHHDAFVDLFRRGGKVRIILPTPDDDALMKIVAAEFFPRLSGGEIVRKIADTVDALQVALAESGSAKAGLEVWYFPHLPHFAAPRANGRHLYMSVYEHFKVANIRSSIFHIDLARNGKLMAYWTDHFDEFLRLSAQHV